MSRRKSMHHGVLVIDKPCAMTSTDVVRAIRKIMMTGRVGHAGTLDPDASGVLVVCVGEATKAVPFFMDDQKEYECDALLGSETVSDDASGESIRNAAWDHVTADQLQAELATYTGTIQQIPPRVSALKHDGKRFYERVRAGEDVDELLSPRAVITHSLKMETWKPPAFQLSMTVGKGFYVRSLVRDLGRRLNSAAHVTRIRRTRVGPFGVDDALQLADVTTASLKSLTEALNHLPIATAGAEATNRFQNGQRIRPGDDVTVPNDLQAGHPVCLQTESGDLIAVGELTNEGVLRVVRGFSVAESN